MLKILRGKYDDQIISERLYSPELTEIVQVTDDTNRFFVGHLSFDAIICVHYRCRIKVKRLAIA
eukprot:COSAG04_NODE_3198_length_3061_cov_25.008778_4_plen_64_part_00